MPTPYHTLSDDTLNLLAERGNAQALMELAHRAERLGILAEAQELANRLREDLLKRLSAEAQQYETAGPPHIRNLLLEAKAEIRRLRNEMQSFRECLRVVREYVSSELADDPSQDDPSCELYPLIELVRERPER